MTPSILACTERAAVWVSGAALAAAALYVTAAVIAPLLGFELPDEDVFVSEAVVAVAFLPQLLLVTSDRQLSVDIFTNVMPGCMQRWLGAFAQLCGIVTFLLLGWAGWLALERALQFGSVNPGMLGLPEWPGRAIVVFGCLGGLLGCVLRLIRRNGREQRNQVI